MTTVATGHVMPIIAVESVDAARDYYLNKLGFTHQMGVVGKDGLLDFVTVVMGGARVMFMRDPAAEAAATGNARKQPVQMYVEVENVDAYHDSIKKKGVTITDSLKLQWWGDKTFKVLDPNGYEIWFYSTVGEVQPPQGAKIV
jgi:PhnB protein